VFFSDKLYPVGHEAAFESEEGYVTLKAKIPKRAKAWDDKEVREFLSQDPSMPNKNIGAESAFMIQKGIAPTDLHVVLPGSRKTVPLRKFVKSPAFSKLKSDLEAADAEMQARYGGSK